MTNQQQTPQGITIAIVGDVHDQWDAADAAALKHLGVDLVLLVGDFGNEAVELVRAIAKLDLPKAVILGNHDSWYTASDWGRRQCPYDYRKEDRVQAQLDLLAETHVGYSYLDFPQFDLTVVGGRPFSWGGSTWRNAKFYRDRYQVMSFAESTARIVASAAAASQSTVLMLGHCGPLGLGNRPEDPCGKDWKPVGGDYGDPDLAAAIAQIKAMGKRIPLVTFGHMHHNLRHQAGITRTMLALDPDETVYLNAARVPRKLCPTPHHCLHNFSLVRLEQGRVTRVALAWVEATGAIASEEVLYNTGRSMAQSASAWSH